MMHLVNDQNIRIIRESLCLPLQEELSIAAGKQRKQKKVEVRNRKYMFVWQPVYCIKVLK